MTLAQRVRDYRYAKGWGPDELAQRASISRTALYQIESGKTEQPRAATLRRIAEALSVPTENLLSQNGLGTVSVPSGSAMLESNFVRPMTVPEESVEDIDAFHVGARVHPAFGSSGAWMIAHRERDLERKFHELLRTPLGESVARIVEETHRLIPNRIEAIR